MQQNFQPQQPTLSSTPAPLKNKKTRLIIIFGSILVILLIISFGIYFLSENNALRRWISSSPSEPLFDIQDNFVPDIKNELFIANIEEDGSLNILIFNPIENRVITSKKISLGSFSNLSFQKEGANNAVQYNPRTQEIFFSTLGRSPYDGSCIIEENDICPSSQLLKIRLDQTQPTILFESSDFINNWIINNFDNSLLLSFVDRGIQTLKKINSQDGKVVFTRTREIKGGADFTDFVLSKDGKYTYQKSKESPDETLWYNGILKLRKIDNSSGDVTEQKVIDGVTWIQDKTNLSPDNNYLAFYAATHSYSENPDVQEKLYIYEIPTEKLVSIPYKGIVQNRNLVWSGDSKRLLYWLGMSELVSSLVFVKSFLDELTGGRTPSEPPSDSLAYYDISTAKHISLSVRSPHVFSWGPSVNHFVYESPNGEIKIYDIQKNKAINTQIKMGIFGVKGFSWY